MGRDLRRSLVWTKSPCPPDGYQSHFEIQANLRVPETLQSGMCSAKIKLLTMILATGCALLTGCSNQDPGKTREDAAKATAKVKEETKAAVKELKKTADEARVQTQAAAEGVREGLKSDAHTLDLNRASRVQLKQLPGIDNRSANAIIAGRPYHTKDELSTKGIVSPEEYTKIESLVAVK
jgi:DNA uptake protein ComE-like DNA-binding protein